MLLTFCVCIRNSSRQVKGKIYLVYWYKKVVLNLYIVIHRIRGKFAVWYSSNLPKNMFFVIRKLALEYLMETAQIRKVDGAL